MFICDYCSKIVIKIPNICHRCGHEFCSEHHAPKNHHCTCLPKLRNPLLLGVEMFFADIPYIVKGNYDIDRNNCQKFSKHVQNDATRYGIRCGVVLIGFHKCPTGHALVAFETDFGLKFFEPQTANEEEVIIGHHYTATLFGVLDDDVITQAEIFWNDGEHTTIKSNMK